MTGSIVLSASAWPALLVSGSESAYAGAMSGIGPLSWGLLAPLADQAGWWTAVVITGLLVAALISDLAPDFWESLQFVACLLMMFFLIAALPLILLGTLLRQAWQRGWALWARFWLALGLWRHLGRRWSVAWRNADREE
ncbi:MAG: hypothetical protein JNK99_15630 [Candidatus Accumulibacter sp.]|uniref:hypothetical protein n=1 Tax=Accumulibacter sp. TaxID=2053492 RepID=UPI001A4385A8|nr:hypothetical protein [Accumulibacter sp.]MBL8396150.1 hypothetical protein [Accumulibacter sp.]